MSVYNGQRFLREAVESVLSQTLDDLELIVVDDGSTDATAEILAEYSAADARMVVERQANAGRATALNRGFDLARAPFVARLDADDVALAERLELQRRFLEAHGTVAAVGGAVVFIDEEGRAFAEWRYPLTHDEISRAFESTTPLAHPAAMVRATAFEGVGGYRPVFVESEDVDLWLRLAAVHELANVPEVVLCYRVHSEQASVQRLEVQTLCSLAARAAARARRNGRPDPMETLEQIDRPALLALGITEHEITSAFVQDATWLGRMTGKAGYAEASEQLFARAAEQAGSEFGSPDQAAAVYRARAALLREHGRPVQAAAMTVRARSAALKARLESRSRGSRG